MELSDNLRKIYREYIYGKKERIFFTFSFFKILIEKKINLNKFNDVCAYLFTNEFFLNKYLGGDISDNEISILWGKFSEGTHIDLYRNYFRSVNEIISESNGVKIVELTAYGTSKTQNRKIIAFRGIFKNGLLVSYESKVDNCESDSFSKNDLLSSKYVLNKQEFLVELIRYDFNDILDQTLVNAIMLHWFNSVKKKIAIIKKFVNQKSGWFIGNNPDLGLLFESYTFQSYWLDYDFFEKDGLNLKRLKRHEFRGGRGDGGYFLNDFLSLFYKYLTKNDLYSENIKKISPSIYSMINFQVEQDALEEIKKLKLDSIVKAKEIKVQNERVIELEKKQEVNNYKFAFIFILILLFLIYLIW